MPSIFMGGIFLVMVWTDLRVGAVLREQNFALRGIEIVKKTAKDDVDNVGAGRAAKGASPASSSKTKQPIEIGCFVFIEPSRPAD